MLKKYIKKLLELISNLSKIARYEVNTQKSVVFLYTSSEQSKKEIKIILFIIISKKMLRNKFDFKKSKICTLKNT